MAAPVCCPRRCANLSSSRCATMTRAPAANSGIALVAPRNASGAAWSALLQPCGARPGSARPARGSRQSVRSRGHPYADGTQQLVAVEHGAGIHVRRGAEPLQERLQVGQVLVRQQPAQCRALRRARARRSAHPRCARVSSARASAPASCTRARSWESARRPQQVDGEPGHAGRHQHHDQDIDRSQPPAQAVALHRCRYPARHSTRVLITSVATASSDSSEATAKAPTKL